MQPDTWHAMRAWAKATRTEPPKPQSPRWRVQKCCRKPDHDDWWVINHFTKHFDSTHKTREAARAAAKKLNTPVRKP